MEIPNIPQNKDLTYLGSTTFRDKNQLFGIKRKDRRQHMYILGKSGTGKSALMFNMVIQNIINGEGVCLVDPHGENVEAVLSAIPEHRLKDVVYFNPADIDYNIGFNVLELVDPKYKHLVASGLMGIFTKIWANVWSSRIEYILNNTILALLDTPGTTLLGIPRMLVDKDYRQKIIANLKDPVVKAFWIHEYEAWQEKFRNEAIAPIQNKVGQFLSSSVIRNIIGQSQSTINVFDIMNEGKIFLVNVSKGRIGEDNSKLLGGMIVTKIQLAAMERVRIKEEERRDFYLYVDEFQNFVTDSFASILSEARKYRLSLTVAHQYIAQLVTKEGMAMRDSIFGNVGTMILFRSGSDDAKFLEKELAPAFTPEDLLNLPNYRIYLKLMIDGVTSRPFSARTLPPLVKGGDEEIEKKVIQTSRENYCRPRVDVEKEINDWSGGISKDENEHIGNKFKIVCATCGKESEVPFKPEPGRAVYCKDCVAKIKAGELKPVKLPKIKKGDDEDIFYEPLAVLGIEFKSKNTDIASNLDSNIDKEELNQKDKKDFAPKESKVKKKNFVLKSLLNKVLGDSSDLDEEKKEIIREVKREEEPPISLSVLKKEQEKIDTKKATEEKMNDLKNVIEKSQLNKAVDDFEIKKTEEKPNVNLKTTSVFWQEQEQKKEKIDESDKLKVSESPALEEKTNIDFDILKTKTKYTESSDSSKINSAKDFVPKEDAKVKEIPEDVLRKILE